MDETRLLPCSNVRGKQQFVSMGPDKKGRSLDKGRPSRVRISDS
jgi:hypothetical protein